MAKYKKQTSKETVLEAEKIAKATQRPNQSKEQTKLIAQGIQKGIEHYKKQQKSKARELDKKLKNIKASPDQKSQDEAQLTANDSVKNNKSSIFAWLLLILSWAYFIFSK